MREARARMIAEFWPRSLDDVLAVTKGDHPLNAAFRQVGSYWEMVYGMVRHGIVHADYFLESNGEGLNALCIHAKAVSRFSRENHRVTSRTGRTITPYCHSADLVSLRRRR